MKSSLFKPFAGEGCASRKTGRGLDGECRASLKTPSAGGTQTRAATGTYSMEEVCVAVK